VLLVAEVVKGWRWTGIWSSSPRAGPATLPKLRIDGMPTYYVALTIATPSSLKDAAPIRILLDAAERARGVPFEITVTGLVIEAEPGSLNRLDASLRDLLLEHGAEFEDISFRRLLPNDRRAAVGFALLPADSCEPNKLLR